MFLSVHCVENDGWIVRQLSVAILFQKIAFRRLMGQQIKPALVG